MSTIPLNGIKSSGSFRDNTHDDKSKKKNKRSNPDPALDIEEMPVRIELKAVPHFPGMQKRTSSETVNFTTTNDVPSSCDCSSKDSEPRRAERSILNFSNHYKQQLEQRQKMINMAKEIRKRNRKLLDRYRNLLKDNKKNDTGDDDHNKDSLIKQKRSIFGGDKLNSLFNSYAKTIDDEVTKTHPYLEQKYDQLQKMDNHQLESEHNDEKLGKRSLYDIMNMPFDRIIDDVANIHQKYANKRYEGVEPKERNQKIKRSLEEALEKFLCSENEHDETSDGKNKNKEYPLKSLTGLTTAVGNFLLKKRSDMYGLSIKDFLGNSLFSPQAKRTEKNKFRGTKLDAGITRILKSTVRNVENFSKFFKNSISQCFFHSISDFFSKFSGLRP